jgi:hypothetical protein
MPQQHRSLLCSLFACALAWPGWAEERLPARAIPTVHRAPAIDGALGDWRAGATVVPAEGGRWSARAAYSKGALYLAVDVQDERVTPGDLVVLSLFFPSAGTTAGGYTWRFAVDGKRAPDAGTPLFAHEAVSSAGRPFRGGFRIEAKVPARALPRFPARKPLDLELCVTVEDRDDPSHAPRTSSNCDSGSMRGPALRLPDEFRRAVGLKPPEIVEGLEGRPLGWIGFAHLHYPAWVAADRPLDAATLRRLVAERTVDPKEVGINLPDTLFLPRGQPILTVVSGKDPYVDGRCDPDRELRLALYLPRGRTAERVLEWPVSTCALGRAAAVEMNEAGELTLGYTSGETATFVWSKDHFERTEIGSR